MVNEAVVMRARSVRRGHRTATVLLALLAGVAGAIPMIGWEVARRTDRALPEFIDRSGIPSATVFTCPAGFEPAGAGGDDADVAEFFDVCMRNRSIDFAEPLSTLPTVVDVAPAAFVVGKVDVEGQSVVVGFDVGFDPEGRAPDGDGVVVRGRAMDQAATGDVVFDETSWAHRPPGVELGSTLVFTPFLADQAECAAGAPCDPGGEPTSLTVVGVKRMPADLASNAEGSGAVSLSSGFWNTQEADLFTYGIGYNVWFGDGVTADHVERELAEAFPDRFTFVDTRIMGRVDTLPDAIGYQVGAARLFAIISALAGLVFAGQALARQTRRESHDANLLSVLGMTRRELVLAALLRSLPVAVGGAVVAAAITFLASPIGPVGIARGTIITATFSLDPVVLGLGALAVLMCALGCSAVPVLRHRHAEVDRPRPIRFGGSRLPAPVLAGARAALPRRSDTSLPIVLGVAGTALAVATVIAAATLIAGLREVTDEPANYGVAWDLLVGNNGSPEDEAASFAEIADIEGIDAASGIMSAQVAAGDVTAPLVAFVPVPGFDPIEPVILDGRAPFQPGEAALGSVTMRRLGVDIGDTIEFDLVDLPGPSITVTVVGAAALNDGFDVEVGDGILVDGAWARSQSPGSSAQSVALRVDPDHLSDVMAAAEERFGQFVALPEPPSSVRDLVRVDALPVLLAAVVIGLALASLAHAMWVSIRQRRFELGVLRTIGFSRRQVWWSIATQAILVAALAVVIGIVGGVIGGGWGWRAIARAVGVAVSPTFVPLAIIGCLVGALVAAVVAAAIPGWQAAHTRPADALRTE